MSSSPAHLKPAAERPFPIRARRDLRVAEAAYEGTSYRVVKDPVTLDYYRLHVEQHFVLTLLDGRQSLEAIRAAFLREFPTRRLTLNDLCALVADFHRKRLVSSDRPGQGDALLDEGRRERRQRLRGALRNVFYIRLPGWDPERTLARLQPFCGWLFHPWGVALCVLFVLSSWGMLAVRFGDVERSLPKFHQFFGWPNVALLWLALGGAKVVHELAHGLACRRFGGECHSIGVAFLVFSPCLYCDVSDSWLLPGKWRRIAVASAGIYVEVLLSSAALLVWWWTRPGLLHYLALNAFFVSSLTTILFNLNPLLQFDGYYILADWLEIPNLRQKADRLLSRAFARACLGIELPEDPFLPATRRGGFALYAAASGAYRWFIAFSLVFVLYEFLKPYGLQSLGLLLGAASLALIVIGAGQTVIRIVAAPGVRPMSRFRAFAAASAVAALAAAAVSIPIPLRREAPFVVEPRGVKPVYVVTPGELAEVHVRPGDRVRKGDVLARLTSFAQADQLARLRAARDVQRIELAIQQSLQSAAGIRIAEEALRGLDEQVRDAERQVERLAIAAPCDGIVIAPQETAEPGGGDPRERRLPVRRGTPLDPRNLGGWCAAGTHLLSIAPEPGFDALVFIDQGLRDDLAEGTAASVKLDLRPLETLEARLGPIAERPADFVPQSLSNRFGGPLATQTAGDGRERLSEAAFQASVFLNEDADILRSGARGMARFTVDRRTAGQWLWRTVRSTFHFRL